MTKSKSFKMPRFSTIFYFFVLIVMVMTMVIAAWGVNHVTTVIANAPKLDPADFESKDSTKIYDRDGVLIADIGFQIRENITYEMLPQTTIDAFLAIEDSRFFEHNGFDIPRFIKAIFENLKTMSFSQGGSTFTMQLVKNTYFSSENTEAADSGWAGINRKIGEIYLALETEKIVTKERILELYLNQVNFGVPGNKRGIQTAAQYYFGKTVGELNLVESALLAGVINGPGIFSPLKSLEMSTQRTHTVLDLMKYHGYINDEELELAKSVQIENLIVGSFESVGSPYQSYIDVVINEVIALTGQNPVDVPMAIYTYMDRQTQDTVENIQNGNTINWIDENLQMATLAVDNRTGQIVAIGGGRNYNGERLFNRVTDMFKQPGSTAKAILSYPLAFEYLGWSTKHVLSDEPYSYSIINPEMIVSNHNNRYKGDVLLEEAIGDSLNIPAILTLKQITGMIGSAQVVRYLNSIGFTDVELGTGDMVFDLGFAIGGSLFRVSPLQLAGAYTMLFNEGRYTKPHTVARVEYLDGTNPLVTNYSQTQVLSEESAFLVQKLLQSIVTTGWFQNNRLVRKDYQTFQKTGTTDWGKEGLRFGIPENASKDIWSVTSSSQHSIVTWVGFDAASSEHRSYIDRAINTQNYIGKIPSQILDALYFNRAKPLDIVKPENVTSLTHVLGIFPYVSPLPDMNPDLVVTGLINKKFATISPITVSAVLNPVDMQVLATNNGPQKRLTITLPDYPVPEALVEAPPTREMTLTVADVTVNATGARLFDMSWVFGPVRYFSRIVVDGVTVDTLMSASPILEVDLSVNPSNSLVVCGYYAYEKAITKSVEVCKTVDLKALEIQAPTTLVDEDIDTLVEWFTSNGLTNYTISYTLPSTFDDTKLGKIASVTNLVAGQSYSYDDLVALNIDVVVYDKVIDLFSTFVNKSYATPTWYDYAQYLQPSAGAIVTSVEVNYTPITSATGVYMLSELHDLIAQVQGRVRLLTTP
jgi:penicillin-binding protein 1A